MVTIWGIRRAMRRRRIASKDDLNQTNKARHVHQCLYIPSLLSFIEIDMDSSQLSIVITNIFSGGVNAMFGGHDLEKQMRTRVM
jgi:hypothetical protein